MKTIIIGLLAIVGSAWYLDLVSTTFPANSALLWVSRQEGMYLTGLLSITFMSLAMLLATRPAWLEKPLGGLDRVYRLHKWVGILAIGFGASHWLIKQSGGLIKSLIGTAGRLPKIKYSGMLEVLRELAADMGEPALYIALAMLVITLWRRFPYHIWRHLHRIMPVLYLMLALHASLLAPPAYWSQPVGLLLAAVLSIGVVSSIVVLAGLIGRRRQVNGSALAVKREGDVTELTCHLEEQWNNHRAGQFAFVTFDWVEGAHPFTIASADRGNRTITFYIKALGNFTQNLAQRVRTGQKVKIEGPYGRFQLERHNPDSHQIWVAGGIGVTPFLAWLESLQARPADARDADFHYCTQDREKDPFVGRLKALCAALPGIRLQVHSAKHGDLLTAGSLKLAGGQRNKTEVWFCGPSGFADALKRGLKASWNGRLRFHQEAFELR